jgi:phosphoglycolate phosphatase-like HAD superfamily hydrolase
VTVEALRRARVVFWDFDGVIKESVSVKTDAFEALFRPFGEDLARRVRGHHEAHSGVSRYQKVPIYLGWAGEAATEETVREYCDRLGGLVRQRVVDAPWVPGVMEYLTARCGEQQFVLVTATPQEEIEGILGELGIAHCFREVHGAPTSKADAIGDVLRRWKCAAADVVMVGDSDADLGAASRNGVTFVLRRTRLNRALQEAHGGESFESL